ncbi:MAG: threonine/serine exporter family protein [Clostridia bacterium]|nr:threonine/serine exporter family protein [Clostridia bacterium]
MKETLSNVMEVGEQMLLCGAEVHRVEEGIKRMCLALGAVRTDVFIITSSMVVTVYNQKGEYFTQTRRVMSSGTDYEKLNRLNALCREISAGKIPAEEIKTKCREAVQVKHYPFALECVCYSVIAGAFTLFFGGTVTQMAVSLFAGAAVRFVILLCEKTVPSKMFSKFLSCATATLIAFIAVKLCIIGDVDKVVIGNIMSLIPGIGLTNALRDLFTGDSIAGILRSVEAVLTALAIAAGYFLIAVLGGFLI